MLGTTQEKIALFDSGLYFIGMYTNDNIQQNERVKVMIILWIIGIYIGLGVITTIISLMKDPILFYAWMFIPVFILIWPYVLWVGVLFPKNTGRWI